MVEKQEIITDYVDIPLNTPIDLISKKVAQVTNGFKSHKTLSLDFRREQLRNLYYAIYDNMDLLKETLKLDLNKSSLEANISELAYLLKEIYYFIENLDRLAEPESVPIEFFMRPAAAKIEKHPLGTVLIISPWNYPVLLSLSPVASAIAAGNTVVLKVSELSPHTSRAIVMLLQAHLDPEIFVGITGAIPESTALLKEKFDKIMYTGNGNVGRVVARAATNNLTPVILELGGKSPAIITKHANLYLAARRLLWGKQMNAGQTCVAPDYILIEESIKDSFIKELKLAYDEFYPSNIDKDTEWYSHIINTKHYNRLKEILNNTKGKIVLGGTTDDSSKFIAPTFIEGITSTDSLMQDEIFGPLIGIITVANVDEAIKFIEREHDTPLALYVFSDNVKEQRDIVSKTRSGAVGINDPMIHVSLMNAPFGGVGQSGYGAYHGKDGFEAFSHRRTVFSQSAIIEPLFGMRYPPYNKNKETQYRLVGMPPKPWFARKGPVRKSLFRKLFTLRNILLLGIARLIMTFLYPRIEEHLDFAVLLQDIQSLLFYIWGLGVAFVNFWRNIDWDEYGRGDLYDRQLNGQIN
jgi:aldehyde dehydrogenase (NAD+)